MELDLTKEEKSAIRRLKSLAKVWPDSLWLFSGSATLWVMRRGEDGHSAMTNKGGVDQDYCITNIDIDNDGGDWD